MSKKLSTDYLPYSVENGAATARDGQRERPKLETRQSVHAMMNPDEFDYGDDEESIDENLEISSIASSIEDQLT